MSKKIKVKLPKRIAGVKIPKSVRKGPIASFLNSSAGQLILAEALIVAGSAFAVQHTDADGRTGDLLRHPVDGFKRVGRAARAQTDEATDALSRSSARFAFALDEAIRAFRAALNDQSAMPQEGARTRGDLSTDGEMLRGELAKKKHSPPTEPGTPH